MEAATEVAGDAKQNPPSLLTKKIKYLSTVAIFVGNIILGCTFTAYSPALVDFKNKYESDTPTISIVLSVLTVGYLLGALTSGFIYKWLNRQLAIIIFLLGMSLAMYVSPHCPNIMSLYATGALLGFSCGAYDAAQVVWMIEIWQAKALPYIQAQHFFFAVGTLLPSLMMAPFLTEDVDDEEQDDGSPLVSTLAPSKNADMWIPFTIAGGLASAAAVYVAVLFIFHRYVPPPPEQGRIDVMIIDAQIGAAEKSGDGKKFGGSNENNGVGDKNDGAVDNLGKAEAGEILVSASAESAKLLKWYRIKLIALAALFLGPYQGMEVCTMQFVPTFAQYGDLGLSEREGARILTWLAAAYAAGRAIGIVIVLKVPPHRILAVNLAILIGANALLLAIGGNSITVLRIGAVLLGVGFSTIYASFCGFIERYLVFTNFVGAFVMVCGSFVATIYPIIIGNLIDSNPNVMIYTSFFSLAICLVAFALLYTITVKNAHRMLKQ